MAQLNEYFSREEFACKCGCGFNTVDTALIGILVRVREYFGKPVYISSACRCPAHNERVGGSQHSQHKLGRAADIMVGDTDPQDVAAYLENIDVPGLGEYSTFTHVDSRDTMARWCG